MDRPHRAATKVTDFRRFHLSGDLSDRIEGLVESRIGQFEMAQSAEQLKQQLEEEKENSRKLQEEIELLRMRNEVESRKNETRTMESGPQQTTRS